MLFLMKEIWIHLFIISKTGAELKKLIRKARLCHVLSFNYLPPVFFQLLKLYARFAIYIYCRKVIINKPEYLKIKGPVLFAANHPNSFLDGMILTTLLQQNLYSLARGDAFVPKFNKLLHWLHLLPVYRTSEGVENLSYNYTTFEACQKVFASKGMVMIFCEGRCINEWHLRPLKKGTARLAISTWHKEIDLVVIPVGFNYNTFRNFGKNVILNFGEPLDKEIVLQQLSEGRQLLQFNTLLKEQLEALVYEIDPADKQQLIKKLYIPQSFLKKALLSPFAAIGWLLHAPLYYPVKAFTKSKFDNDHFESVLVALLMLVYLIYLPVLSSIAKIFWGWSAFLLFFIFAPFCAWACVQLKNQVHR